MALYALPKILTGIYNKESYVEANAFNSFSTNQIQTANQNVTQSLNIINTTTNDTLTIQESLIHQNDNDLSISTDDGYILHINNNKPTSGDININENTRNSNVNIVNGNLNIRNGYLNLGNGSIILDGADINAVLVGNQYQLSVQADTLANTEYKVQTQAVTIQETVDVGVVNTNQIVSIQSNYAPLDAPAFTTNLTLPPIVKANNVNVTDVQVSYLSNLSGDVQSAINSLTTNVSSVTSKELQDAANITSLQSSVSTIQTKQTQDEADITSLQSSVSVLQTKQTQDEANITSLQSSVSTIQTKQIQDAANITSLQSSVTTLQTKQTQDEANITSLQSSVSTLQTKQTQDEVSIAAIQTNLSIDGSHISALQSSVSTISTKQTVDESNISSLQSLVQTKANIDSPSFTGVPQVPTANAPSRIIYQWRLTPFFGNVFRMHFEDGFRI